MKKLLVTIMLAVSFIFSACAPTTGAAGATGATTKEVAEIIPEIEAIGVVFFKDIPLISLKVKKRDTPTTIRIVAGKEYRVIGDVTGENIIVTDLVFEPKRTVVVLDEKTGKEIGRWEVQNGNIGFPDPQKKGNQIIIPPVSEVEIYFRDANKNTDARQFHEITETIYVNIPLGTIRTRVLIVEIKENILMGGVFDFE